MKSRIFTILFLLLPSLLLSQNDFKKVYFELGENLKGLSISQSNDGNLQIAADHNKILTKVTLDNSGNFIDSASFKNFTYSIANAEFTSDGGIIMLYSMLDNNTPAFHLLKLNENFQVVWNEFLFYQDGTSSKTNLFITSSDNILLSYIQYNSSDTLRVKYLDSLGSEIWEKKFSNFPSQIAKYPLIELNDGGFLISSSKEIFKLNVNGVTQWSYNCGNIIFAAQEYPLDNSIIVGIPNLLNRLDENGNLTSTYSLYNTRIINGINVFEDNSIIIFAENKFITLNSSFEIEHDIASNFQIYKNKVNQNTFIGTGSFIYDNKINLCAVKNSIDNLITELALILSPNGGELFPSEKSPNQIPIKWYKEGFENISLDFSSDNGNTWKSILADTSLSGNIHNTFIPIINSNQCLVRVFNPDSPQIFDVSNSPFEIYMYKYNDYISANECFMWIGSNGMSAHNPIADNSGFYWPGGKDATVPSIFSDGLLWGGIHNGMIKVNGATYRYGLMPGAILENGSADVYTKREYSIFKLKKNWESLPEGEEKNLMEYNYINWPGEYGAPFTDVNNDGIFSKGIDEPKILGDETLFYVANDLDSQRTPFIYGSPPIGLEFQQTLFAYNTPELKDAVFKKVKLINKSNSPIDSMYISYWIDDDLGYAGDDFVGCDTLLNLAHTYNVDNNDEDYYGVNPPSVGHIMLQGPIVKATKLDTAEVNEKKLIGYKNLTMTSFFFYLAATSLPYMDPPLGVPEGAEMSYNNMKGMIGNGEHVIDPNTNKETKFILSGDPVEKTGWYEGEGWPGGPSASDRRSLMSSGPFTIAPGDTQEIVYAIFMARGSDNIQSVAELKKTAIYLQDFWGSNFVVDVKSESENIPTKFSLSQNYPNPFNPSTTIEYSIPLNVKSETSNGFIPSGVEESSVQLIVYDVLGREVKTLVNQKQTPGNYKVTFASHSGEGRNLASGIYFYQLKFGDLIDTKKMILLK